MQSSGCLICGNELEYASDYQPMTCYYCKHDHPSNVACKNNHYVCDSCHAKSGIDLIETYCNNSLSTDPLQMATEIMQSDKIKMHGPEHHFLVPAVLLAAYCNATQDPTKAEKITIAKNRSEKVLGGFCGTHGNCGAGVGTGIFISIITKSTPLALEEWSLSNLMTGKSLVSIALHGGPRCCKRDTYLAIQESIQFVHEKFNVELESQQITCQFSENNRQCLHEKCLYYVPN